MRMGIDAASALAFLSAGAITVGTAGRGSNTRTVTVFHALFGAGFGTTEIMGNAAAVFTRRSLCFSRRAGACLPGTAGTSAGNTSRYAASVGAGLTARTGHAGTRICRNACSVRACFAAGTSRTTLSARTNTASVRTGLSVRTSYSGTRICGSRRSGRTTGSGAAAAVGTGIGSVRTAGFA